MIERWSRLIRKNPRHGVFTTTHPLWLLSERLLQLADCFYIPEVLIWLNNQVKRNTRGLSKEETKLAQAIFGSAIDYAQVRLDEKAQLGCRSGHFAYVGFQVINSWGVLSDSHFIHEMVHVWQYQRHGAGYIACALWAQRTPQGYNYGGISAIRAAAENKFGLESFNYEQQGDIVADYFRLQKGEKPRWCEPNPEYIRDFQKVIRRSIPQ